jgi:hypothetical protein
MAEAEWTEAGAAYPYPFGGEFGLPDARVARNGIVDAGTQALARSGQQINMRQRLDALEPQPVSGLRRWPLVDSLGRELAQLEKLGNRWQLLEPGGGDVIYMDQQNSRGHLLVQGRGCMVNDELEESHALVAFNAGDRRTLPEGASIVPFRLRAFIDRRALPKRRGFTRVRTMLDDFFAGSDADPGGHGPVDELADPGFSSSERFLGIDGRARTYATYNGKPPYHGAIYISINTTGVHGGGIVRGVAQVGDEIERVDEIGYGDPNSESGTPVATWYYGRVAGTRLAGWIPERYSTA